MAYKCDYHGCRKNAEYTLWWGEVRGEDFNQVDFSHSCRTHPLDIIREQKNRIAPDLVTKVDSIGKPLPEIRHSIEMGLKESAA